MTRVRCTEAPAARSKAGQVTVPPLSVPPSEAETKEVPAGTVSVSTTPVAFWLPTLDTVMVYVKLSPGRASVTPSSLVTAMSGAASSGTTVGSSSAGVEGSLEGSAGSSSQSPEAQLVRVETPDATGFATCTS